ncbi:MAG: hypothetical protein ABS43_05800 [Bordetella sp. SCN 67-23]|nr:MAG: hypothetical protein ABS43_05800 [Bordetella sp. SCN 67-23]OJW88948.1 MAG: hypothetical protein BGO71_04685 [Burkholderiales bacterium 67-32]
MRTRVHRFPSLNGRVILITGGARGLGREMALALAEQGAKLAIGGSRPSAELDETVAEIRVMVGHAQAVGMVVDVTDFQACRSSVEAVERALGPIDVLVNNAALGMLAVNVSYTTETTRFWTIDPAGWRKIVDANVNGTFHMSRAVVPGMVSRRFGKVINISTSNSTINRKGYTPYGPSKAAIESMSRAWAAELAGTGVDVNCYLPGGASQTAILPPGTTGSDGNLFPAEIMRRGIGWLCADESNGITGERYVARLWDETLSSDEAARKAMDMHY